MHYVTWWDSWRPANIYEKVKKNILLGLGSVALWNFLWRKNKQKKSQAKTHCLFILFFLISFTAVQFLRLGCVCVSLFLSVPVCVCGWGWGVCVGVWVCQLQLSSRLCLSVLVLNQQYRALWWSSPDQRLALSQCRLIYYDNNSSSKEQLVRPVISSTLPFEYCKHTCKQDVNVD